MSLVVNAQTRSPPLPPKRRGHSNRAVLETIAEQSARIDQLQRQLLATQGQLADIVSQVVTMALTPRLRLDSSSPDHLPRDLVQWLPVFLRDHADPLPPGWADVPSDD